MVEASEPSSRFLSTTSVSSPGISRCHRPRLHQKNGLHAHLGLYGVFRGSWHQVITNVPRRRLAAGKVATVAMRVAMTWSSSLKVLFQSLACPILAQLSPIVPGESEA